MTHYHFFLNHQGNVIVERWERSTTTRIPITTPSITSSSWSLGFIECKQNKVLLLKSNYTNTVPSRVGYRLSFFRYRCQIDTFKTVPVPKRCLNRYLFYISISIYIYLYLYIYISISIYLYIYLYISIYIYIYLSIYIYIYIYIYKSIYLYIDIYIYTVYGTHEAPGNPQYGQRHC